MTPRRAITAAGAVVFALPLVSVWREPTLPVALPVLASLIFAVTVARPSVGLCLLAAFLPAAPAIHASGGLASAMSVGQLLVLPFLAAGCARFAMASAVAPARLTHPTWIFAVVIAVSGATFTAASLAHESIASAGAEVWAHVTRAYFAPPGALPDLHVAAAWIEALALAVLAERILRQDRQLAASVLRLAITGAAVTVLFTLNRVAQLAVASDAPFGAVVHAIRTMRLSWFYDVNASGSLQVLYLVPAVWMAVTRRERWLWLAVAVIGLGLWFSGSRAAILAAFGGAAVAWTLGRRAPRRWWVAGVMLVVGVSAVAAWGLRPGRATLGEALVIRWNLAVASLQVTATDPVVGVGPGRLHSASAPFITPAFARWWPPASSGENAHNNFLQVLAESGVLGFIAFVWMLAATVGPRARWRENAAAEALWPGSVGAVAAFLLTCLSGHPLLIEPVRFCFFLWVGIAAAGVTFDASSTPRRWPAVVVAASLLLVAAILPGRIAAARRGANLEGLRLGVGPPAGAVDGVNYRVIERESSWFIGTWGTSMEWTLRADAGSAAPCRVEIDLDHQQASVVSISADAWTPVRLDLPAAPAGQGSRRLDVHVRTDGCTLLAGSLRTR